MGVVAAVGPGTERVEQRAGPGGEIDDLDVEALAVLRFEEGRAGAVDTDDHPPSLRRTPPARKPVPDRTGSAHRATRGQNRHVHRNPSRNLRRHGIVAAVSAAIAVATLGACGGDSGPSGIAEDVRPVASTVPSWFPAEFTAPTGAVIINYIARPETGAVPIGRSVTWLVDRPYDKVVAEVDAAIAAAGWTPTDRVVTAETGSRRTSVYIETDRVKVVRTFTDDTLSGVRISVELPPR